MERQRALRLAVASIAAAVLAVASPSRAASIYWDVNGTGAGASDSDIASGSWDLATSANWSSDVDGLSATADYTTAGGGSATDVVFSAGTNATGSYAIALPGSVSARGLVFEEGTLSLNKGIDPAALNVRGGGITVQAGSGAVSLGDSGGGLSIEAQGNQIWANYSTNKLLIGGGRFTGGNGATVTMTAGQIQLGNQGRNNAFRSDQGTGTLKVDGATLIWSLSSTGIGSNSFTFTSGTMNILEAKGLGKGFRLEGDFRFENRGNPWRDVTLAGADGFSPTITVDTSSATSFTGYRLIATAANQTLTLNSAATRTLNVGFMADASSPALVLDGAGTYSLATGSSTMAGAITLKNGTFSIGADPVVTSGALASSPLGVGTVKLVGGSMQAVTAARTIRNNISFDGNMSFGGAFGITFDGVTDLTVPSTFTLTGDRTLTANQTAGAITFVGAIGEDAVGRQLTKSGSGQLVLGAGETLANSYTGLTTVTAGELGLAKAAGVVAIAGDLAVTGGSVRLYADEQIADSSDVTLAGTLNLGGFAETFDSLAVDPSTASLIGGSLLTVNTLVVGTQTYVDGTYTSSELPWIGDGAVISVGVVPEPVAMGMLLGAGFLVMRRRR